MRRLSLLVTNGRSHAFWQEGRIRLPVVIWKRGLHNLLVICLRVGKGGSRHVLYMLQGPQPLRSKDHMDHMETPFQIDIPEESIRALRQKLEITTFPDELEDAGLKYGAPLENIKRLVSQWKVFDWRQQEVQLNNELPQFTRDIEVDGFRTLNIHYVHQQSKVANAIPLLFVHGCMPWLSISCSRLIFQ